MKEMSPAMTPQLANVYKATGENITFSKKQQWTITNYTVLVYAGLFGLSRSLHETLTNCEKLILTIIAAGTFLCAAYLLIEIQKDMGRYRVRLEKMHNEWFNAHERDVMDIAPYTNPALRGVHFLVALIGVTAIGAGIAVYSVWR